MYYYVICFLFQKVKTLNLFSNHFYHVLMNQELKLCSQITLVERTRVYHQTSFQPFSKQIEHVLFIRSESAGVEESKWNKLSNKYSSIKIWWISDKAFLSPRPQPTPCRSKKWEVQRWNKNIIISGKSHFTAGVRLLNSKSYNTGGLIHMNKISSKAFSKVKKCSPRTNNELVGEILN